MVKLTGSEKQIAWAETIRVDLLDGLEGLTVDVEASIVRGEEPDDYTETTLWLGTQIKLINRFIGK